MIEVDVRLNIAEVKRMLGSQLKAEIDKAVPTTLNRVASSTRTVAVREINKITGLKGASIRERLAIQRATRALPEARIIAKKYAPNLINFQARQTKRGVSANAWRKRKVYTGAFIANQGRTVFTRVGAARLPIKALKGPSVPRTFMQDAVDSAMRKTINERWPVEFERQVAFRIGRL